MIQLLSLNYKPSELTAPTQTQSIIFIQSPTCVASSWVIVKWVELVKWKKKYERVDSFTNHYSQQGKINTNKKIYLFKQPDIFQPIARLQGNHIMH